jgi:hypothetical protein
LAGDAVDDMLRGDLPVRPRRAGAGGLSREPGRQRKRHRPQSLLAGVGGIQAVPNSAEVSARLRGGIERIRGLEDEVVRLGPVDGQRLLVRRAGEVAQLTRQLVDRKSILVLRVLLQLVGVVADLELVERGERGPQHDQHQ